MLQAHMRTRVVAVGSLVARFCLFIAFGAISVNVYDEKPRPGWLVSLLVVAIGLILAPIVGAFLAAIAETLR